jgi:DNA topoisomerase-1
MAAHVGIGNSSSGRRSRALGAAGHVSDDRPGIMRRRAETGFDYLDEGGELIDDYETLSRIKKLAIPPAWENVWICSLADGHIQATGRDARGRKQYRYHPRWRETRDEPSSIGC